MRSSYSEKDVTILLKDITGLVEPLPAEIREKYIQSGTHYCEMLPLEYKPGEKYFSLYREALKNYSEITAEAVAVVSEKIRKKIKGQIVLVSLARAGTPVGILIKRYLNMRYQELDVRHYTISIIRGRGIDKNAMQYILERHKPESICFVDGWTGKGAILNTLKRELSEYPGVSDSLAVLADPANITELYGTRSDFLIPSSCLNSTVSGLISRTFLRPDIIGENDFHGAAYYEGLESEDLSAEFIDTVISKINPEKDYFPHEEESSVVTGLDEVKRIQRDFDIDDINLIKPGIGETTRVLLRRIPWKILVNSTKDTDYLAHIFRLAEEKGVEVVQYPMERYRACGIIKKMADM